MNEEKKSMEKTRSRETEDRIRVLHVDDSSYQLKYAKLFLEKADPALQLKSASTPEEALHKLSQPFDCIVADYRMWGIDVFEIYYKLRERSQAPLILYTGRGSEEVAEAAFAVGVDDYVKKELDPSHYQVLAKRIRTAVEKHRAEERLRESEERFRGIAERSFDLIYTMDVEGRFTYLSPAMERIIGLKPEELLGKSVQELANGPEFLHSLQALARARTGENIEGLQVEMQRKDGTKANLEINASPITKDGNAVGTQGVVRDITKRKEAEKEVRLLSYVAQQTSEGIAVSDLEGKLVFANRAWSEMHGYDPKELIDEDTSVFYDKKRLYRSLQEKIRSEGSMKVRISHIKKDGTIFPTLATWTLLKDEKDKPIGIVRIAKDLREIIRDIKDVKLLKETSGQTQM